MGSTSTKCRSCDTCNQADEDAAGLPGVSIAGSSDHLSSVENSPTRKLSDVGDSPLSPRSRWSGASVGPTSEPEEDVDWLQKVSPLMGVKNADELKELCEVTGIGSEKLSAQLGGSINGILDAEQEELNREELRVERISRRISNKKAASGANKSAAENMVRNSVRQFKDLDGEALKAEVDKLADDASGASNDPSSCLDNLSEPGEKQRNSLQKNITKAIAFDHGAMETEKDPDDRMDRVFRKNLRRTASNLSLMSTLGRAVSERLKIIVENPRAIHAFYDLDSADLGRGSYGAVKRARVKSTSATRAVKVISKDQCKEGFGALKNEIFISKKVDHPNVVKLYEIFEDSENLYLVLELCAAGHLFAYIRTQRGPLRDYQSVLIMRQILRGVSYLHSCHIVHRDLKPQNVLVTRPDISRDAGNSLRIPDTLRFDCYPEDDPNEQNCVARGCCWRKPSLSNVDGQVPLNEPYCFYPTNYGYRLESKVKTQTGYLLKLAKQGHPGPYGKDVQNLTVDLRFEARDRLHFKIYDANNERYEVPIATPKVETQAATLDYDVSVSPFPFGVSVKRKSTGTVIFNSGVGGMVFEDQFIQVSSLLPSHVLYGLGEHVDPLLLNTNWTRGTLFARDQGTPEGLSNLYGVFPYYISLENDGNANGVFLLNSNAMDIILQPTPAITYRTIGGILDFYVFLGPTPDLVVQQFTAVVGRPFMPPYWGLGFHLCRWGYGSLNGTITVNENMRKYGIPQDVQWNDIEYMDRHLDFTINQSNWGGLGDFVKKLHDTFHQRYIPIVDPGISSTQPQGSYPPFDVGLQMGIFINSSNGQTFIGRVWPGLTAFPDFTYSVTQAYWEQMLSQFRNLVEYDGLWIDMNEPSNQLDGSPNGCPADSPLDHPPYATHVSGTNLYSKTVCMSAKHHDYSHYDVHSLYGLTEMEKTVSALRKLRGKRSVVISRSTFPSAGLHGGHWLGDNTATFNDLYLSIPGILNFNLFGVPLVGADICGFNGNTNKDLCARWTQLGAFYPFSRNHNTLNAASQDPAAFGPEFASMARDVLMTRYMLLPYMYTLFAQAHTLGSAVARPLFYEFPTDRATHVIDRQFLLGPVLLITPVLTEGSTSVQGYFPDATWYDGTDGSILQTSGGGGQMHTLQAPWDKIHFHFRGGYVIPTQQPDITTYQSRQKPFGLIVALSSTGEASGGLFYDDGESLDPIISAPYLYIHYTVTKGTMKAQVDSKSSYHPEPSLSTIRMLGVSAGPSSVTVNGDPIHSFSFDSSTKVLSIGNLTLPMDKDFTVIWS